MMTAKGLTPIASSPAATGASSRSHGLFAMSLPKRNVACDRIATTITWSPRKRDATSGISREPA
jgi:hypothetical protein